MFTLDEKEKLVGSRIQVFVSAQRAREISEYFEKQRKLAEQ
jgi:hypothetical protein